MTKPLVSARNVSVTLGGVPILRGVTADVARGSVTALVGLNGSGKTTLLRAVLGEVPYAGSLKFHCGHDHTKPNPEHVGYVPQKLAVEARLPLTVRDLLGLALQRRAVVFGISRAMQERMKAMLARVFWSPRDIMDRPVEKLSGGELQRVLLALALDPQPELLLLDEPAAGVDFQDQERFYELLGQLNRDTGVTVLLVSHDLAVIGRHAHRVLCLRDGRVCREGPPAEVLSRGALDEVFR